MGRGGGGEGGFAVSSGRPACSSKRNELVNLNDLPPLLLLQQEVARAACLNAEDLSEEHVMGPGAPIAAGRFTTPAAATFWWRSGQAGSRDAHQCD